MNNIIKSISATQTITNYKDSEDAKKEDTLLFLVVFLPPLAYLPIENIHSAWNEIGRAHV